MSIIVRDLHQSKMKSQLNDFPMRSDTCRSHCLGWNRLCKFHACSNLWDQVIPNRVEFYVVTILFLKILEFDVGHGQKTYIILMAKTNLAMKYMKVKSCNKSTKKTWEQELTSGFELLVKNNCVQNQRTLFPRVQINRDNMRYLITDVYTL